MANPENKPVDLEKVRDDICFPIVKSIFKEFPAGLIVDDEKQKELQLKALSAMLSADLNVSQEVSYISQVVLGVLAALNRTIQEIGLTNDEERYDGIACEMLQIVTGELDNISLGGVTPEESIKDFSGVKAKLEKLFADENLSQIEVKYVMQKVFESFTTFNNAISSSISSSTEKMESKILGIESMNDLTLKKLNEELLK